MGLVSGQWWAGHFPGTFLHHLHMLHFGGNNKFCIPSIFSPFPTSKSETLPASVSQARQGKCPVSPPCTVGPHSHGRRYAYMEGRRQASGRFLGHTQGRAGDTHGILDTYTGISLSLSLSVSRKEGRPHCCCTAGSEQKKTVTGGGKSLFSHWVE